VAPAARQILPEAGTSVPEATAARGQIAEITRRCRGTALAGVQLRVRSGVRRLRARVRDDVTGIAPVAAAIQGSGAVLLPRPPAIGTGTTTMLATTTLLSSSQ
jgi:hypothetical protein